MNEQEREALWKAYQRLMRGEWPEDVLGELPDNAPSNIARYNAEEAIEDILGGWWISRRQHTEDLGRTEKEWLRWYTVGRFRYGEVRHKEPGVGLLATVIVAILTATLVTVAGVLLVR